jgi:hypothetical protein
MRKLLFVFVGLASVLALWREEAEEDGIAVALSPFIAALAIEAAILLLSRRRDGMLREG